MNLRGLAYYAGVVVSAISVLILYLSYVMLISGKAIVVTGIVLLAYYIITGTVGGVLTALGRTRHRHMSLIPLALGVLQILIVLSILHKIGSLNIAVLFLFLPPALLIWRSASR